MIEGHCTCGFIRYQADGPLSDETNCHCSICRRTSAAPFVAWATVPKAGFRVLVGEPASFRSSEIGTRTFCPRCGTPLTFCSDQSPDELDLTICSLDEPDEVRPKDHTWVSSKLSWVDLDDALPKFQRARTE
jgi:hypothetical protein